MPIFEYKCDCGLVFEKIVKHNDRNEPQECECGKLAAKIPISQCSFQLKGKWFKTGGEY